MIDNRIRKFVKRKFHSQTQMCSFYWGPSVLPSAVAESSVRDHPSYRSRISVHEIIVQWRLILYICASGRNVLKGQGKRGDGLRRVYIRGAREKQMCDSITCEVLRGRDGTRKLHKVRSRSTGIESQCTLIDSRVARHAAFIKSAELMLQRRYGNTQSFLFWTELPSVTSQCPILLGKTISLWRSEKEHQYIFQ
jgi:hypothetical protein